MTAETWPAAGAHEDPIRPQWMGNMDDAGMLFADPSSAYDLHALIDPAIRQRWMQVAEARRDQRPRSWVIEYRTGAGQTSRVSWCARLSVPTPAEAWSVFKATTAVGPLPAGARLVLLAGSVGVQ
jgi:hypothetical protein